MVIGVDCQVFHTAFIYLYVIIRRLRKVQDHFCKQRSYVVDTTVGYVCQVATTSKHGMHWNAHLISGKRVSGRSSIPGLQPGSVAWGHPLHQTSPLCRCDSQRWDLVPYGHSLHKTAVLLGPHPVLWRNCCPPESAGCHSLLPFSTASGGEDTWEHRSSGVFSNLGISKKRNYRRIQQPWSTHFLADQENLRCLAGLLSPQAYNHENGSWRWQFSMAASWEDDDGHS